MNVALPQLARRAIVEPPDPKSIKPREQHGMVRSALRALEGAFDQPFSLIDAESGELLYAASAGLTCDFSPHLELLKEMARRELPEIIEQESPLMMLSVPLGRLEQGRGLVAVGMFIEMRVRHESEIASAARVFGIDAARTLKWSQGCEIWTPRVLLRLAAAVLENVQHRSQVSHLQFEINDAVAHARDTYVELGLLHRLARSLDVTQEPDRLWRRAVDWLAEAAPAQCVALVGLDAQQVIHGECPLNPAELGEMVDRLGKAAQRPLVLNRSHTSAPTWGFPAVRELVCVPIVAGARVEAWLLAMNHAGTAAAPLCEFGSAEVRLLDSVGSILGVHRSNTRLFQRQGDLFAASVRALTSAIDANDPYTHGHSARVARVAVCLAEQMNLDKEQLDTIYLGGLLHDIGKIGVDGHVLNKPGPLTPGEFEQIKQHPRLGHDILRGVRQLEKILPIVLHHHEAWDGSGYPLGLSGEQTPLLARVTAVADAYDAMSSDRPYRSGMDDAKLDAIFREGAGRQWDPLVVDAFFACRDRILRASSDESVGFVTLDLMQWVS